MAVAVAVRVAVCVRVCVEVNVAVPVDVAVKVPVAVPVAVAVFVSVAVLGVLVGVLVGGSGASKWILFALMLDPATLQKNPHPVPVWFIEVVWAIAVSSVPSRKNLIDVPLILTSNMLPFNGVPDAVPT